MQTAAVVEVQGNHHDEEFNGLLARVEARFAELVASRSVPLFTTDAPDVWSTYLGGFAEGAERQYHNCTACRRFVERFGGLVTIDVHGRTASALWDEDAAPDHYSAAIAAVARAVRRAKVTGVFLTSEHEWGTRDTGPWRHLSLVPPPALVYRKTVLTAGQKAAEKREDFKTVSRALADFTPAHLRTALRLLDSDALYRSEKILGQAKWLSDLKSETHDQRGAAKANLIWRAVALAPAGFCHPRSGMIGTLLEDIAAGMDFDEVSRRFAEKMHPLRYQRPQAAPTSGAIAAAEKRVAELGAAGSLARRFARVDEVQALWRPAPKPEAAAAATGGVFGHLTPKGAAASPAMRIPAQTMTWEKFQREVLPTAERIQVLAPGHSAHYTALVTAVNADAPPILQWDRDDARNPVSLYVWHRGAPAAQYGLAGGTFVDVEAVAFGPSMWNGGHEHQGKNLVFILAGARESRSAGAAIFPETLRSEFHGIRSVIEAYSRSATIEGMDEPHAAGLVYGAGLAAWDADVRVWAGGQSLDYRLDRWD